MTDTNYNDGKWHVWNGGECPVHPESKVECIYENKVMARIDRHTFEGARFPPTTIAFRVTKEPREWWAVTSPSGMHVGMWESQEIAIDIRSEQNGGEVIHVREVTGDDT